ncbi:hypothetical protein VTP01DRAFT_2743 [Rhizomucor pusillus]|uniref:uncharacterized protein n=1 Tax=Rhizomucor pusillus TaxID=4840 RepID=UPI0037446F26
MNESSTKVNILRRSKIICQGCAARRINGLGTWLVVLLHLGATTTQRVEEVHARNKNALGSSGSISTVTSKIDKWIRSKVPKVHNRNIVFIIIVIIIKGEESYHSYSVGDSDWANNTKSDVLYISDLKSPRLPPILIEIQHTVSMEFMDRAIRYCLSVKQTHKMMPILLLICVHKLSGPKLASKLKPSDEFPYRKEMQCDIWVQKCLLLSSNTIESHVAMTNMHLLIAVGLFLTKQMKLLLGLRQRKDATIQLLYQIAKEKIGVQSRR